MEKDFDKILIQPQEISARVAEVAKQIDKDYEGKSPIVIAVLKGSILFYADLIRSMKTDVVLDFIEISSYGNGTVSGKIKFIKDCDFDVKDKDVLFVEDIVDSGNTIVELKEIMAEHGASESRICTMLLKPDAYKKDIPLDYVAMEIPNDFIVGFGLDYDELGRNLKDIYVLDA